MHRFYIPSVSGDACELGEEESRHCVKVLRLKENDAVEITDGRGNLFDAVIEDANPKTCSLKITQHHKEAAPSWELIVAVAPTKNVARLEWLVEKLTEIGFTKFIPVECHNSERKVLKTERLKRIAMEAMKQSGRVYLPQIEELIPFEKLLNKYNQFQEQKFIPHCNLVDSGQSDSYRTSVDSNLERKSLSSVYKRGESALVIIGPEGDFTKGEIDLAIQNRFIPITLNEHTLRTETAALAAAIILKTLNQIGNLSL